VGIKMSVRICGHWLRITKTIKPYTLTKHGVALLVLSMILITPAYAADVPAHQRASIPQASSASVPPCFPSKVSSMDKTVPRTGMALQNQRSAGSPSAAMVLAMALGVRIVPGPMERAQPVQRPSTKQVFLKSDGKRCVAQNAGESRVAMER
jgi:hypothetical protein